ncbi:hypothetical protein GA0070623_3391 [Micromonospora rifamycinica]|uniref:Uncharacterized protein n=1 Tax=Micromonospora rifamycinica TaxID=291594 RepID=A0A1C5JF89_9ACTN|nr:hypothetical protein GA0070623_3391 [Micromonospora rifamycinica]
MPLVVGTAAEALARKEGAASGRPGIAGGGGKGGAGIGPGGGGGGGTAGPGGGTGGPGTGGTGPGGTGTGPGTGTGVGAGLGAGSGLNGDGLGAGSGLNGDGLGAGSGVGLGVGSGSGVGGVGGWTGCGGCAGSGGSGLTGTDRYTPPAASPDRLPVPVAASSASAAETRLSPGTETLARAVPPSDPPRCPGTTAGAAGSSTGWPGREEVDPDPSPAVECGVGVRPADSTLVPAWSPVPVVVDTAPAAWPTALVGGAGGGADPSSVEVAGAPAR